LERAIERLKPLAPAAHGPGVLDPDGNLIDLFAPRPKA